MERRIAVRFVLQHPDAAPFVRRNLEASGLAIHVEATDRRQLVARGTLRQLGQLFRVEFVRFNARGFPCRGLSRNATLPAPLADRVLFIAGLKTYPPAPQGIRAAGPQAAGTQRIRAAGPYSRATSVMRSY